MQAPIEYAESLPQAAYAIVTPYLVPPGPKRVNVGDGFILDSATRLIGARPAAAFSAHAPLSDEDIERINALACLVAAGANTLKDDFELVPGFDRATLERIKVPVILMGVGHYGSPAATRGMSAASRALFDAFLERFPYISVRCDASRRYVLGAMPGREESLLMTSCPVLHPVDGIDKAFERKPEYRQLAVTLTDRSDLAEQLPILDWAPRLFRARRRILALHQDYGNARLHQYARQRGYEVMAGANHQDFLALYRDTDLHFGNRVHAHLKCLSLGIVSYCTPFDLRQAYFAESLDQPLIRTLPDEALASYDFARLRARRDMAQATMRRFVDAVNAAIGRAAAAAA